MIRFFYKLYNSIKDRNLLLKQLRFYSLLRYLSRSVINMIIPIYFKLTYRNKKYKLQHDDISKNEKLIISLTSFPGRINRLWLVIESLMRQTVKPHRIILYLSKNQFEGFQALPSSLLKMQSKGLEIEFCDDDLRSHKKYFYALKEFSDHLVMTVDDDVFYHPEVVEVLLKLHQKYPEAICCHLASLLTLKNNKLAPYMEWIDVMGEQLSPNLFMPIGMGGILYPPASMHPMLFEPGIFKDLCFHADDLWLNMMSRLNKTPVAKSGLDLICLPVMNKNDFALTSLNVFGGENDRQLSAIRNYLKDHLRDPLCDIEINPTCDEK